MEKSPPVLSDVAPVYNFLYKSRVFKKNSNNIEVSVEN